MNIHVSKLLQKMEAELVKAKGSQADHEIRERIIVIQSLCDIILDDKATGIHIPLPQTNEINPTELQKMMGNLSSPSASSPNNANTYKEDDANGDSLFDF